MILSMSDQALLFLIATGSGAGIGFLYDILRIFRRVVKHSNIAVSLEDLFYWLIVSVVMFYIMLNKNYGEIRAFSILGSFLGMGLYFFTLSFLVVKASVSVINFFKKIFSAIMKIILFPIKTLLHFVSIPFKKVLQKSKRYAKIKKHKFKNNLKIIFKKV